jgi:RNA polymerase sigma-70 factor (ECF subfamily)
VTLEEAAAASVSDDHDARLDRQRTLERLLALIQALKPIDRQLMLLHLEGMDAASIGDVTGLSAGNVATKLSRIRTLLVEKFKTATGERDDI